MFKVGDWVQLNEKPVPVRTNNWTEWVMPFVGQILVVEEINNNGAVLKTLQGKVIHWSKAEPFPPPAFSLDNLKYADPRDIVRLRHGL